MSPKKLLSNRFKALADKLDEELSELRALVSSEVDELVSATFDERDPFLKERRLRGLAQRITPPIDPRSLRTNRQELERRLTVRAIAGLNQRINKRAEDLVLIASDANLITGPEELWEKLKIAKIRFQRRTDGLVVPLLAWSTVICCLRDHYPESFKSSGDNDREHAKDSVAALRLLSRVVSHSPLPAKRLGRKPEYDPRKSPVPKPSQLHHEHKNDDKPLFVVDRLKREIRFEGKPLTINANSEFEVLAALYEADGKVVKHLDLYRAVKPSEAKAMQGMNEATQQIKDAVSAIRNALKAAGAPHEIKSIRGIGYRLLLADG